ncbi:hypothetical protein EIP91_001153 [Steccherinum ochraceum]|uniref:Uncharacterized protein n=1 Tax=Steccherinum ochraceum TaxID=92696 RepID=A0A4R0RGY0_9APHY|nr:hypothetical protein EIP91_001153 [Steccherinum ochraceum]
MRPIAIAAVAVATASPSLATSSQGALKRVVSGRALARRSGTVDNADSHILFPRAFTRPRVVRSWQDEIGEGLSDLSSGLTGISRYSAPLKGNNGLM